MKRKAFIDSASEGIVHRTQGVLSTHYQKVFPYIRVDSPVKLRQIYSTQYEKNRSYDPYRKKPLKLTVEFLLFTEIASCGEAGIIEPDAAQETSNQ